MKKGKNLLVAIRYLAVTVHFYQIRGERKEREGKGGRGRGGGTSCLMCIYLQAIAIIVLVAIDLNSKHWLTCICVAIENLKIT